MIWLRRLLIVAFGVAGLFLLSLGGFANAQRGNPAELGMCDTLPHTRSALLLIGAGLAALGAAVALFFKRSGTAVAVAGAVISAGLFIAWVALDGDRSLDCAFGA